MSIGLVYLARGKDDGLISAKKFFDAYTAFPPGCSHELIVIAKGWTDMQERYKLEQLTQLHSASIVDLPDDGFDWGAYMRLVPSLTHDWLCFLNTHSRPRVNGWLNFLRIAANTHDDIGAVGATASWGSIAQLPRLPSLSSETQTPFLYPLRLIRNTIRFVVNLRYFPAFPNPHLRSNAFIVRRSLFLDFASTHKIPSSKHEAYMLESGRAGFTIFLTNQGFRTLVASADGRVSGHDQWINSGTFRCPNQPGLLVEDNQTIAYENADSHTKNILEMDAWNHKFN
ncbi:MAG: hypothetical protein H7Z73_05160 [Candidatus Saccharibacteria bacterium]|nr:hypothetical protein [Moraxellaceae bacterium]